MNKQRAHDWTTIEDVSLWTSYEHTHPIFTFKFRWAWMYPMPFQLNTPQCARCLKTSCCAGGLVI